MLPEGKSIGEILQYRVKVLNILIGDDVLIHLEAENLIQINEQRKFLSYDERGEMLGMRARAMDALRYFS